MLIRMIIKGLSFKDRQQERTAVLSRSYLKALCAFAPNALYVYYI